MHLPSSNLMLLPKGKIKFKLLFVQPSNTTQVSHATPCKVLLPTSALVPEKKRIFWADNIILDLFTIGLAGLNPGKGVTGELVW